MHLFNGIEGGGRRVACCVLSWLLLTLLAPGLRQATVAQAQPADSPLLANIRGDIWAWAGAGTTLQQRTNWGYNKNPILSLDGRLIAYKSTATIAVDAIKRVGGIGGGDLPANIWVLDVTTNDAVRVADQPADASFQMQAVPDKYVVRSDPVWSPDGKSLAWSELIMDTSTNAEGTNQVVIYNLEQKTQKVIAPKLPPQYGVPGALKIAWGEPGIALWSIAAVNDPDKGWYGEDSILVYDTSGKLLSSTVIERLSEFAWIQERDRDYVGVLSLGPADGTGDPQWILVDPATGRITGMPGLPELYSLAAPDGLSLVPTALGTSPEWAIADRGKPLSKLGSVDDVYVFSPMLAISPDGKQLAYVKQGALYVYNEGKATKVSVSDVGGLAWGPTGWRVRHGMN
jgi:hypothetical protein